MYKTYGIEFLKALLKVLIRNSIIYFITFHLNVYIVFLSLVYNSRIIKNTLACRYC